MYQLENFSISFARLETKLNVPSLLHHYELLLRYKILNTTGHERQYRSDRENDGRVSLHGQVETYSYVLLNARNELCPGM
jgi:hypothetical protein